MSTDVRTVPPDATIEEFLSVHLVGQRRRSVPVVDEANRYLGMAVLDEVVTIRREAWATTDIRTIARARRRGAAPPGWCATRWAPWSGPTPTSSPSWTATTGSWAW